MKRIGASFCAVAIAMVMGLMVSGSARAARLDLEVKSLKGLSGVHVVVETLDPDISKDGLSADTVEKTVIQHLSAGGIKLLSADDLSKSDGAIFYVSLSSVKSDMGLYACSVHAELIQAAALARDPDIMTPATTWTSGTVGIVGAANVTQLTQTVADITDEFVKDYKTANTGPAVKPKIA